MKSAEHDVVMRRMTNEAISMFQDGRTQDALALARSAFEKFARDPGFDETDLDALNAFTMMGDESGDIDFGLEAMREIARVTGVPAYINGFNYFRFAHHSQAGAIATDLDPALDPATCGKTVLIACIPKTGSTFLLGMLTSLLQFSGPKLCLNYANEENVLSPELVRARFTMDKVAQEHCRATPQNIALAQAMDAYTVVLVRNIFDSIISMRDMLLGDEFGSTNAFFSDDLPAMSGEAQLDAVIAKWAHWQLEFLVSWQVALHAGRVRGHILTYEDLMADKATEIGRICAAIGQPVDASAINDTVTALESRPHDSRLNVGRSGRGREAMSAAQMDRIRTLTAIYPDADFSPLGL